MGGLKQRWVLFLQIALDPWTLLFLAATVFLIVVAAFEQAPLTSALLLVLITIASGVLGARITDQWNKYTEGGALAARGKVAVRGLKLLLRNIAALETRIQSFRKNEADIDKNPQVTRRNLEEVIATCRMLQEETVSSIENWTDIVDEADIKTQIGEISQLKTSLEAREAELTKLQQLLKDAQGQSEQAKKDLRQLIADKERQLSDMRSELLKQSLGLGGLAAAGPFTTVTSADPSIATLIPRITASERKDILTSFKSFIQSDDDDKK